MTLDRGWTRRGFGSSFPQARVLTPAWEETEVTFYRRGLADDGFGGFAGGQEAAYLTQWCHAELSNKAMPWRPATSFEAASRHGGPTGGTSVRGFFISMRTPSDLSLIPKRDDYLRFVDSSGIRRDVPVTAVTPGVGVLEIACEELD